LKDPIKVTRVKELTRENRHSLDYFRCPEAYASYQLTGRLSPDSGFFRWDEDTIGFGRTASGERADSTEAISYDVEPDLDVRSSVPRLPFDPQEVIENLQRERYSTHFRKKDRLSQTIIRKLYYLARPFLGVAVRRHLQTFHLRNWYKISFPEWPVDFTLDRLHQKLLALGMTARGAERVPFIWFWPDGFKSCAVVTHDVEDEPGKGYCNQLMDLDESYGFLSSFQLVPEGRYSVTDEFLESFTERGFEVNVHDLRHDGRLFTEHAEFLRRARRINQYGRDFRALGFRSGVLYRNADWFEALDFQYDSSIPNVGHLDPQRGGCCTVLPYFIGKMVELPVTCTQDYTLFNVLKDYSIDLWKKQIGMITAQSGLTGILVHPDYILESRAREVYRALLGYLAELRETEKIWTPLPREVATWWRQRREMKLVQEDGRWRVAGPGSERACVAYAHLSGGTVSYALDEARSAVA
jgi:hypothetical protein